MGTRYHIRFQLPAPSFDAVALQVAVDARLEALNASLSTYRSDSLITAFNEAAPGQVMPVDEDFQNMVRLSRQVHLASGGAFDPTVGGLVNLWGFGWPKPEQPLTRLPEPAAIEAAKARFDAVEQPAPGQIVKRAPLRLDFSAIAKGYGVDQIAQVVRAQGIEHYMVEIGGEVATRGRGPAGGPWRIGIEEPHEHHFHDGRVRYAGDIAIGFPGGGKISQKLIGSDHVPGAIQAFQQSGQAVASSHASPVWLRAFMQMKSLALRQKPTNVLCVVKTSLRVIANAASISQVRQKITKFAFAYRRSAPQTGKRFA